MTEAQQPLLLEINDMLKQPGCVICALVRRSLQRYLSALAYESVTDVREREIIRAARGFCADHGRMLRDGRAALGSALIYRDVLIHLGKDLEALAQRTPDMGDRLMRALRGSSAGDPMPERTACPACQRVDDVERLYCGAMAVGMDRPDIQAGFAVSSGLCAPHLRATLQLATPAQAGRLRDAQITIWKALVAELDEFIRKQDHHARHERSGSEADAWRRAIDLVSGEPGLVD